MGKVAMPPWMTTTTTTKEQQEQEQEHHSLTSSPPQPERIMKIGSLPTPIPGEEYNSNTHIAPILFSQQQPQHPKSLLGRREINNNSDVHPNDDENSSSSSSSQHHDWASSDRNDGNDHDHEDNRDPDPSLVEHRTLEERGGNTQWATKTAPTSNLQQHLLKAVKRRPNSPPPPQPPRPLDGDTALLVDNTDRVITIQKKRESSKASKIVKDDSVSDTDDYLHGRRNGLHEDRHHRTGQLVAAATPLVERKESNPEKQHVMVVNNVPWDSTNTTSRPEEWMNAQKIISKDEPTITTARTNTTFSGTTTNGEQQQQQQTQPNGVGTARVTLPTPRSILLQENKTSSIQSTLGGSVNGYDDDDDELAAAEEEEYVKEHRHPPSKAINKSMPIWAKARENMRSTSTVDWSKVQQGQNWQFVTHISNSTIKSNGNNPPRSNTNGTSTFRPSFEECSLYHPAHIDSHIFPTVDGHSETGTTTAKRRTVIVEFD
jgi:hypothetical protein